MEVNVVMIRSIHRIMSLPLRLIRREHVYLLRPCLRRAEECYLNRNIGLNLCTTMCTSTESFLSRSSFIDPRHQRRAPSNISQDQIQFPEEEKKSRYQIQSS